VSQSNLSRSVYSAHLGFHIDDHFALELGYLDLGEVDMTITGSNADVNTFLEAISMVYPVTAKGWTAAIVASAAINDNFNLLAKVGLFSWRSDYTLSSTTKSRSFDTDGNDVFFGLAVERELVPRWPFRLGCTQYRLDNVIVGSWELVIYFRS
jgi:hypothetical protein